ncbi:MAG: V-type ATP synthase subunit E [Candidatus Hermodarchaeota archaeon]
MRKQFGNLGLYLIEKAQKEIDDFNRQTLFQKAEIKKRYIERSQERTLKLKDQFIENYYQFLNQSLSSTLLEGKDKFLNLKNKLIKELKVSLFNNIKVNISNNYKEYIQFVLSLIRKINKTVDKPQAIELIFNTKDYNYFLQNSEKIQDLFKNTIQINKDNTNFIGGFKISLSEGLISYDYTIDTLINKKSSFIQKEISRIVDASEIKLIEKEFNLFIQNQKSKIMEYLKQYDQIQI